MLYGHKENKNTVSATAHLMSSLISKYLCTWIYLAFIYQFPFLSCELYGHGTWLVPPSPAHEATHAEPPFVGLLPSCAKISNEPYFRFHREEIKVRVDMEAFVSTIRNIKR